MKCKIKKDNEWNGFHNCFFPSLSTLIWLASPTFKNVLCLKNPWKNLPTRNGKVEQKLWGGRTKSRTDNVEHGMLCARCKLGLFYNCSSARVMNVEREIWSRRLTGAIIFVIACDDEFQLERRYNTHILTQTHTHTGSFSPILLH